MIVLLDNGSKRAESTINLRRLAAALSERRGEPVYPVSLQHSASIAPDELDGTPAQTLEDFLSRETGEGTRDFVVVPLFFGPSRAIDGLLPDIITRVEAREGAIRVQVAPELCPLPQGEPRLVDILEDNVRQAAGEHGLRAGAVVLVDHGSPVPAVTAVRHWLANGLGERLRGETRVAEAVMERRQGASYDFNGQLLERSLAELGPRQTTVVLAMQFVSPGRHAGAGGDVEAIAREAMQRYPGLRVLLSRLVSEHPLFTEVLDSRVDDAAGRFVTR
ncbi:MAG: CbiX/SirB N-terminal domain-containing protein [Thiohalocapsa sp.]|jgi:sirohydrochlorin ferrochelatase